jgi:hypothetical protein
MLNTGDALRLLRKGRMPEAIYLLNWTDRGQDQEEQRKGQHIPESGQATRR